MFFVIRCDSKQCCQAFHAVNGHDQANVAWPQDAIHHGGCTPNHALMALLQKWNYIRPRTLENFIITAWTKWHLQVQSSAAAF